MKKNWWKILGAILVLYALGAGLMIPLKSGIESVNKGTVQSGETVTLGIKGYNTHYQETNNNKAWLKLDSLHIIAALETSAISNEQLNATFLIPSERVGVTAPEFTLIVSNEIDGYAVLPVALSLEQRETETKVGKWESNMEGIQRVEQLSFPYRTILYETIRNLYYHVPLWFGMMIIFFTSAFYSVLYLLRGGYNNDARTLALNQAGILFGILGLVTGAIWANWTWGAPWSGDVKQNMSAIVMLIYLAYLVLRSAFDDYDQRAKISAVYNIFACITIIPLLFVIPRLYDSLHPGNGGNPGFGGYDLDNTMKWVFYPAVIGWTILGFWLANLSYRYLKLKNKWLESEEIFT